jgi:type III pantothenate kinase
VLFRSDGGSLDHVDRFVLASVVPATTTALRSLAERRGIQIVEASAETLGVPVHVDAPSEVGADRLVNALAVARLYGTPAIVVDLGTATTFDVVDRSGAYVGGAIAPGLELGLEALSARAARLPRVELRRPDRAIGRDTISAMQSGAVLGYLGLLRELLARIRSELGEAGSDARPTVVLTGGLSVTPWMRELADVDVVDPELTLKGLVMLAEREAAPHGPPTFARSRPVMEAER